MIVMGSISVVYTYDYRKEIPLEAKSATIITMQPMYANTIICPPPPLFFLVIYVIRCPTRCVGVWPLLATMATSSLSVTDRR